MTTSDLIGTDSTDIARRPGERLDRHPAAVYLAGLESQHSRRTMRQTRDTIAGILTEDADARTLPWAQLRFQHTQAVRAELAQRYARDVQQGLSALRGVLGADWRGRLPARDPDEAGKGQAAADGSLERTG